MKELKKAAFYGLAIGILFGCITAYIILKSVYQYG
jgi:hypothetical protein